MSRLVQAQPRGAKAFSGNGAKDIKDYLDRVARYVPAEILAAYLRRCKLINISNVTHLHCRPSNAVRLDDIVPFAMEFVRININLFHFFRCDLAPRWIFAVIQPAPYR
jgi:hypothetical protein